MLDSGAVAVALRQMWAGARFKSKDVVLGVASRRILVREYTTQAMPPDLLRDALPFQVQDMLPVPASQAVLDFFPLAQEGDQVSGLLVAAVSDNIEQIVSTLSKIKVRTRAVDLTAFGLARVTAPLISPEATVATINIGDHTTQVVISRGGVPLFVRLLPIDVPTAAARRGNAEIIEPALELAPRATARGVSDQSATGRTRGAIRAAAPPGVTDLAARLRSTLAFFGSRANSVPLARVFVTGAGAAVDGVLPAMDAAIDIPMTDRERWRCHRDVKSTADGRHRAQPCRHHRHRARGGRPMSAISVPRSGPARVNLMPRSEVARRERDALVRRWVWIALGAVIVALLIIAGAFAFKFVAEQGLAAEQARTDVPLTEITSLSEVSQALATESELIDLRSDAMASDLAWSPVIAGVNGILPPGTTLTGFDLTVGGAPLGDDPSLEQGLVGTMTIDSPTPLDIVAIIRSLRGVEGVLFADGQSVTSSQQTVERFTYLLDVQFDQSVYSNLYAARGRSMMPKHIVTAVGLIVSVGVIALGVFLVALPVYFQAVAVDAQTAAVASTNEVYQTQVDGLHAQEANIDQINANVAQLRAQIPATGQYDDVFEVIGRAAEASAVSIDSVTAGEQVVFVARTGADTDGAVAPVADPPRSRPLVRPTHQRERRIAAPIPDVATTAGRQQVDFAISATAVDMGQAIAFLDALRAGPRLLRSITAMTTQSGDSAVAIQVSALTYIDGEG